MVKKLSSKSSKTSKTKTNKYILADRKKTKRQNQNSNRNCDPIRIFSYNVSWESLSGAKSGWELCNNAVDPKHPRHHTVCTGNICQAIEENPSDFITLQEAGEYQKLIDQSPRMAKMLYKACKSGKEVIITFWNGNGNYWIILVGNLKLADHGLPVFLRICVWVVIVIRVVVWFWSMFILDIIMKRKNASI